MGEAINGDEPLARADRDRLARLVAEHGETAAVEALGIPRQTMARLLGGLKVRAGTRALVLQALDREESRKGARR